MAASQLARLVDLARLLGYTGLTHEEYQRAIGALVAHEAPSLAPADVGLVTADIWRVSQLPLPVPVEEVYEEAEIDPPEARRGESPERMFAARLVPSERPTVSLAQRGAGEPWPKASRRRWA